MAKILLVVFGLLIVVSGLMVVFGGGTPPEAQCAEDELITSGFVDDETGCPISIESAEEILDWESQNILQREPVRGVGSLLLVVSVIGLLVSGALAVATRQKSTGLADATTY